MIRRGQTTDPWTPQVVLTQPTVARNSSLIGFAALAADDYGSELGLLVETTATEICLCLVVRGLWCMTGESICCAMYGRPSHGAGVAEADLALPEPRMCGAHVDRAAARSSTPAADGRGREAVGDPAVVNTPHRLREVLHQRRQLDHDSDVERRWWTMSRSWSMVSQGLVR
jgi:hypothetical protein